MFKNVKYQINDKSKWQLWHNAWRITLYVALLL